MSNKLIKKRLKLVSKWLALAVFLFIIVFLQMRFGKLARDSFFLFSGGLGMFVYGMNMMSANLQVIAGNSLKTIISALTKNSFLAMLTGVIITAIIQSSSATTVMVVGFVNAGLMTLGQAIGVVLGANVGTTVTAQLIAFKLTDMAWPILAIGSALIFIAKSKNNRAVGEVLVGFALLFLGMKFMGEPLLQYKDHEVFKQIFISFSEYRFLGVLAGLLVTLFVQSSSATVGLTMSLIGSGAFGADPFLALMSAIPIIMGDNIGTCITAILASIGTNRNARRAALAHLSLNTCGTVLILPFLEPYCRFIALTSDDLMRQVANAHSIFNILIVCVFLPLTDQLKKLILFIIPVAENEEIQLTNLDKRFLQTPPIALNQAESHLKMVAVTVKNKINIILTVLRQKPGNNDEIIEKFAKFEEYSKQRKQVGRDLNQFLVYLAQKELSDEMSREVTRLIYLNKDLEIIATQLGKFMGVLFEQAEKNITISESGKDELNICLTRLNEIFADLTRFENLTDEQSANISILINTQNMLIAEARNLLISRIRSSEHSPYESIVLLDSLRSMDSLLSSMRYTFEHLFYKF